MPTILGLLPVVVVLVFVVDVTEEKDVVVLVVIEVEERVLAIVCTVGKLGSEVVVVVVSLHLTLENRLSMLIGSPEGSQLSW